MDTAPIKRWHNHMIFVWYETGQIWLWCLTKRRKKRVLRFCSFVRSTNLNPPTPPLVSYVVHTEWSEHEVCPTGRRNTGPSSVGNSSYYRMDASNIYSEFGQALIIWLQLPVASSSPRGSPCWAFAVLSHGAFHRWHRTSSGRRE